MSKVSWPPTSELADSIRCIFSDVDGVLTDGRITYDSNGVESKTFHVRDGLAIKRWIDAGRHFVIVTARQSEMVSRRAKELGIQSVIQDCSDKHLACETFLNQHDLAWSDVAFIGDDVADCLPIASASLGCVPRDGCQDCIDLAEVQLQARGGDGVVRELIETLMRSAGQWPSPKPETR